jgi:biopolymer transport protein ExbD
MAGNRRFLSEQTEGRFGKRKRQITLETQVDMTSMIDVTFLLLIFFMVTASLEPSNEVDLPPAEFGKGVDAGTATVITVTQPQGGGGFANVVVGEGTGAAVHDLAEVTEAVQAGLAEGRLHVIVQAERRVHHREVQRVFRAAAAVDGVTPHIGIRDKN